MPDEEKTDEKPVKAEPKQVFCRHCGEPCGNAGLCVTCRENGRK